MNILLQKKRKTKRQNPNIFGFCWVDRKKQSERIAFLAGHEERLSIKNVKIYVCNFLEGIDNCGLYERIQALA